MKKTNMTAGKKHKSVRASSRIYADAAAATPIHPRVQKRILSLLNVFGNPGALHAEALIAKRELEKARGEIASAIGAHPDEIIFTACGTESNNLALMGTLRPLLREHTALHVITLPIEHQAIIEPLQELARDGSSVTYVPVDADGRVSPKKIGEAIRGDTVLVSVQMVNNEIGTIEPIREIAKMVRRARTLRRAQGNTLPLLFHTDAAQAPLYLDIKVESLGIDMMSLDAQKVLGPKGVGVLYVKRGVPLSPAMFGGTQERGIRPGTANCVLAGAFAEALTLAQKGVEARAKKVATVRDGLLTDMRKSFPDMVVNGSLEHRVANNLNLSIPGLDGETAVIALDSYGIAVSTRSACATGHGEPTYVVKALGADDARVRGAIRITLLPTATRADAKRIVRALKEVCALYREREQV